MLNVFYGEGDSGERKGGKTQLSVRLGGDSGA